MTSYERPSRVIARPTMLASRPKRRVQNACESTARVRAAPGSSSPGSKTRPATGRTPSARKNPALTVAPVTRSGVSKPVSVKLAECSAPKSESDWFMSRMSQKFASVSVTVARPRDGIEPQTWTSRSGSGNGSGFSSTP